jgi:hypothetical protein
MASGILKVFHVSAKIGVAIFMVNDFGRIGSYYTCTPHDPENDAGGNLSSWQGHSSR